MTLDELQIGQSATLTTVGGEGALRQHFLDMGLIPGEEPKKEEDEESPLPPMPKDEGPAPSLYSE